MTTGTGAGPSGSNDRSSTRQGRGARQPPATRSGEVGVPLGTDSASHSVTLYASTETAAWRLARAERDRRTAQPRLRSRATTWTAEGWLRVWVADETRLASVVVAPLHPAAGGGAAPPHPRGGRLDG